MNWRVILPMAAIAAFFALGFSLQHLWFANEKLSTEKAIAIAERDKAYADISTIQAQQEVAAEIDKRITQELVNAESNNNTLRAQLAYSTRKLRIKANCPATTTGSMGNDSSVELPPATGQSVLDIRAGIIRDRAKIDYLQQYVNKLCVAE